MHRCSGDTKYVRGCLFGIAEHVCSIVTTVLHYWGGGNLLWRLFWCTHFCSGQRPDQSSARWGVNPSSRTNKKVLAPAERKLEISDLNHSSVTSQILHQS